MGTHANMLANGNSHTGVADLQFHGDIVKNLRTTLLGTVDTDLDRALASTRARTVPGVLNVDVDVMVARDLARK